MKARLVRGLAALAAFWVILAVAWPAQALLPAVQGYVDLQVLSATQGAFDIDDARGQTFRAALEAVSCDGSVFPADGRACVEVTTFFLQIGDTSWDETMRPAGQPLIFTLLFGDGSVKGLAGEITPYNPAHPDLFFFLPKSPGTWEARDIRTIIDPETQREIVVDRGTISGMYTPNLVVIPLPGTLGLVALGLALLFGKSRILGRKS